MDKTEDELRAEAALQAANVLGGAVVQPAGPGYTEPPAPPPTTEKRQKPVAKPRTAALPDAGLERIARGIALLFALVVAGVLWYYDGFFTLLWLENMGVKLAGIGIWQWSIPVAITATTLALWPRAGASPLQVAFFAGIVAANIGTSFAGLFTWLSDRIIPIFAGITFPKASILHYATSGVVAIILAFGPEKLGKWAGNELLALWRSVWGIKG